MIGGRVAAAYSASPAAPGKASNGVLGVVVRQLIAVSGGKPIQKGAQPDSSTHTHNRSFLVWSALTQHVAQSSEWLKTELGVGTRLDRTGPCNTLD